MKSVKLLEDQIKIYEELTEKAKSDFEEMKNSYIKAKSIYDDYNKKIEGLRQILER